MDKHIYFVPVDFSDCSYHAVQYATILAKKFNGQVRLFHVADAKGIAESDNPVVVMRSMDRLVERAVARMRSFCEMIAEAWQIKVDFTVTPGNVENTLLNEIKTTRPDMLVFGKNKARSAMLKKILAHTNIPVLVIPSSAKIQEPTNIILTMDMNNLTSEALSPIMSLVETTTQPLSLLHIQKTHKLNGKADKQWAEGIKQKLNLNGNVKFLDEQDKESIGGILGQIQSQYADLLCTVKREKRFFTPLYRNSFSTRLALQAQVPTLVITEKS